MKTLIAILGGILIGLMEIYIPVSPLILFGFIVYMVILFRFPEQGILIMFLAVLNFFSMIDEDFLRMPNLFRIRDLFFLSLFLPIILSKKNWNRLILSLKTPIARGLSFLLLLVLFQLLLTKWRFPDESFNSMIRIGRKYFYFGFFFPCIVFLSSKEKLIRFLKPLIFLSLGFGFLFIIQFFIGPKPLLFLKGRAEYQILQGFKITRQYLCGDSIFPLMFQISFMIFFFMKSPPFKKLGIIILIMSGLQILLSFGRANIFGVIFGTLFSMLLFKHPLQMKHSLRICIFVFCIVMLIEIPFFFIFPDKTSPAAVITKRLSSTFKELIYQQETVGYRIKGSQGRINLVRKNLGIGIGFVHDESSLFEQAKGYGDAVRTTDSGLITFLLDFGIMGIVWFLSFFYLILKQCWIVFNKTNIPFLKGATAGIAAFYVGKCISFITLADFVTYDGILIITLSLVLLQFIKEISGSNEFFRPINNHC